MQGLRLFIIRLLQVGWLLAVIATIGLLFGDAVTALPFFVFAGLSLTIAQYLVFASFKPYELFDGRIKQNLESQGNPND